MASAAQELVGPGWLYLMLRRMSERELAASSGRALELFERLPPDQQEDLCARSAPWAAVTSATRTGRA